MASRTHSVNGFKTVGPVQTQRDHCGRVEWHPKARGQALSANAVRMLLEKFDHAVAKLQHSAPAWYWPPTQKTHQILAPGK